MKEECKRCCYMNPFTESCQIKCDNPSNELVGMMIDLVPSNCPKGIEGKREEFVKNE